MIRQRKKSIAPKQQHRQTNWWCTTQKTTENGENTWQSKPALYAWNVHVIHVRLGNYYFFTLVIRRSFFSSKLMSRYMKAWLNSSPSSTSNEYSIYCETNCSRQTGSRKRKKKREKEKIAHISKNKRQIPWQKKEPQVSDMSQAPLFYDFQQGIFPHFLLAAFLCVCILHFFSSYVLHVQ